VTSTEGLTATCAADIEITSHILANKSRTILDLQCINEYCNLGLIFSCCLLDTVCDNCDYIICTAETKHTFQSTSCDKVAL